ncbi:MAG: hypothetical protein OXE80_11965 [Gammaproteobacteria bacterium]|nr:hypothetical protein [Gammaproteobacteria bacterium]
MGNDLTHVTHLTHITGIAAPYLRNDVLIDQIAPPVAGGHGHGPEMHAVIRRQHPPATAPLAAEEAARHAFPLDRYLPDGRENPGFILNQPAYRDASILLAGRNFGIGGTHTPAAARLLGCGIEAVIAVDFGPVFHDDCLQAGLLPVMLGWSELESIALTVAAAPRLPLTIDLARQTIGRPDTGDIAFQMIPRLRRRFMEGLTDIDETRPFQSEADTFREAHERRQPWIYQSTGEATGETAGKPGGGQQ